VSCIFIIFMAVSRSSLAISLAFIGACLMVLTTPWTWNQGIIANCYGTAAAIVFGYALSALFAACGIVLLLVKVTSVYDKAVVCLLILQMLLGISWSVTWSFSCKSRSYDLMLRVFSGLLGAFTYILMDRITLERADMLASTIGWKSMQSGLRRAWQMEIFIQFFAVICLCLSLNRGYRTLLNVWMCVWILFNIVHTSFYCFAVWLFFCPHQVTLSSIPH